MKYPDDVNGDVFRRMQDSGFDFTVEHIVDFYSVFATVAEADQIARMYFADHNSGDLLTNIETRPREEGGVELILSKRLVVSYEAITEFEKKLAERVSKADGHLDGWGVLQE